MGTDVGSQRDAEVQAPGLLDVLGDLKEETRTGGEKVRGTVVVPVVAGVGTEGTVTIAEDVTPHTHEVRLHHVVERVNGSVRIIYRRSDERRADGAVEIVPAVAVDAVLIIGVRAAEDETVFVVVRSGLVEGCEELVGKSADEPPSCLRDIDTPQAITRVHSETDKAYRSILKDIVPIRRHFPPVALDIQCEYLTADVIALRVDLVVSHRAARAHKEGIDKGMEVVAEVTVFGRVAAPLRHVVELVTQVHGQPSANASAKPLVVHQSFADIDIVRLPEVADAAADLHVSVESGEGSPSVDANAHLRHGMGIAGEEQPTAAQERVGHSVLFGLDTEGDIYNVQARVRIREVGVACAEGIHCGQYGIGPALQPPRERNGKVVVVPTVRTGSRFDDARCEIAAER